MVFSLNHKNSKHKPIFVYGPPKTGTTLFCNLLDGGKGIFVYPNEVKYKTYGVESYASKVDLIRKFKTENLDRLKVPVDKLPKECFLELNKLEGKMEGVNDLGSFFDFRRYYEVLNDKIKENLANLDGPKLIWLDLESVVEATSGIHLRDLKYICFKDVGGNFQRALQSFRINFPEGKVVLITRNPYAQFLSRLKYWEKYSWSNSGLLSQIDSLLRLDQYYRASSHYLSSDENTMLVKYEDLVVHTNETMEEVARFLEVPFERALTFPSVLGKKAVVQTATQQTTQVFNCSVEAWKDKLTGKQKKLVSLLVCSSKLHGYKMVHEESVAANYLISQPLIREIVRSLNGIMARMKT